jgi:hypothetical protein
MLPLVRAKAGPSADLPNGMSQLDSHFRVNERNFWPPEPHFLLLKNF